MSSLRRQLRASNDVPLSPAERLERAIDPIARVDLLTSAAKHFDKRRDCDPEAAGHVTVALDMIEDQVEGLRLTLYGPDRAP